MKRHILMLAALCCAGFAGVATAADRVGDFALLDQEGYFHQMSYYDNHKAIALLVQGNGAKATQANLADFEAARAQYDGKIKFFMLNPTGTESRAAVQKQVAKYGSDIPVLMDHTQLISEALGIEKLGEVLLYDPKDFTVIYRGPAGKPFTQALDQVLAGETVTTAMVETKGAKVKYPARAKHEKLTPSYAKDVAPILAENCASCHREGGIGPFAMNSHAMIQGWAPMIREVVMTKRMPPGQIDPHIGDFKETYTLSAEESQTLLHWIEAGTPKDGSADPLAQLTWPETKWAFGEPDLVIKVPPQEIPATGVLDYIHVTVPIEGLERDRYVKASQYVAGDRAVLHHTLNSLIEPGAPERRGFLGNSNPDAARITAYIPGAQPLREPPNTGGLLKKGSKLALQLHYTTSGRATVDESEIGVWFYDEDEIPQERMSGSCACIFTRGWDPIPPYEADHEMQQTITVSKDAHLYSMLPHMHFRGKRMRFYAEYPDGKTEDLLNIAKYNYNWQLNYELKEPKLLPAGTKITAVGAFDNSEQNPYNPDPAREVPWGQQSWDEMFFGSVTFKYVDQGNGDQEVASN